MLCKLTMASVDEASAGDSFPTFGAPIEKADSEYECDLMIEALTKELTAVRVRKIHRVCKLSSCVSS